jgi:glycosyltransferase involved in cell wall biosynthesis
MREIKLLSIVMPYYNRRELLLNTLKSIEHSKGEYPIEIVIVDDGSNKEHTINDISDIFPTLNINLIVQKRSLNAWRGPTIAYNIGFAAAKGDVIMINCAEGFHAGNIIDYVFQNFKEKSYMSFSAYAGDPKVTETLTKWDGKERINNVIEKIKPLNNEWHSHSSNYTLIPYCAAINMEDMKILSGYDEQFEMGIGYDDYEFVDRVKNLGLDLQLIDVPFCIHQWHKPVLYTNKRNLQLLTALRRSFPNRIKVKTNKIYVK